MQGIVGSMHVRFVSLHGRTRVGYDCTLYVNYSIVSSQVVTLDENMFDRIRCSRVISFTDSCYDYRH